MIVSNDFAIRMMGVHAMQIPEDKQDMTDEVAENVLKKIAGHQNFIDISRCFRLNSKVVKHFSMCTSLLYLDVSYTVITYIDAICENCFNLKSLNLAGLELVDTKFSSLKLLTNVELINFRSSNVNNIDCLSQSFCLRSIDLGHTNIDTFTPLMDKTRLEELLLDCSTVKLTETKLEVQALFQTIGSLRGIRLLNVCQTNMQQYSNHITKHIIKTEIHCESTTRREQFFSAIINNDAAKVYELLCCGQDINMRASELDMASFVAVFRSRCVIKGMQTPFVLCNHKNTARRPAGIHLAVLFNSYDAMQCLLDHHCDKNTSVWFGDVRMDGDMLVDASQPDDNSNNMSGNNLKALTATGSPSKATTPALAGANEYNVKELISAVFARNVHRITDKMFEKKILNWKAVCASYQKRLLLLLNTEKISKRLSTAELNLRNSFAFQIETEDDVVQELELSNVEDHRESSGDGAGHSNFQPSGGSNSSTGNSATKESDDVLPILRMLNIKPDSSSSSAETTTQQTANTKSSLSTPTAGNNNPISKPANNKRVSMSLPEEATGIGSPIGTPSASPVRRKTRSKSMIPPPRPKRYSWRDHSMVKKLTQPAVVITESIPIIVQSVSVAATPNNKANIGKNKNNTLPQLSKQATWTNSGINSDNTSIQYKIKETAVLGSKSFWLESRAHYCNEKAQREAPEYSLPGLGSDHPVRHDMSYAHPVEPTIFIHDDAQKHLPIYNLYEEKSGFKNAVRVHHKSMIELQNKTDTEKISYLVAHKNDVYDEKAEQREREKEEEDKRLALINIEKAERAEKAKQKVKFRDNLQSRHSLQIDVDDGDGDGDDAFGDLRDLRSDKNQSTDSFDDNNSDNGGAPKSPYSLQSDSVDSQDSSAPLRKGYVSISATQQKTDSGTTLPVVVTPVARKPAPLTRQNSSSMARKEDLVNKIKQRLDERYNPKDD